METRKFVSDSIEDLVSEVSTFIGCVPDFVRTSLNESRSWDKDDSKTRWIEKYHQFSAIVILKVNLK